MNHRIAPTERGPSAVSAYDLLLALVPLLLALGVGGAWLLPVSIPVGVLAGGASSALVLGYGLFYRAPVGHGRERTAGRREPPNA